MPRPSKSPVGCATPRESPSSERLPCNTSGSLRRCSPRPPAALGLRRFSGPQSLAATGTAPSPSTAVATAVAQNMTHRWPTYITEANGDRIKGHARILAGRCIDVQTDRVVSAHGPCHIEMSLPDARHEDRSVLLQLECEVIDFIFAGGGVSVKLRISKASAEDDLILQAHVARDDGKQRS